METGKYKTDRATLRILKHFFGFLKVSSLYGLYLLFVIHCTMMLHEASGE